MSASAIGSPCSRSSLWHALPSRIEYAVRITGPNARYDAKPTSRFPDRAFTEEVALTSSPKAPIERAVEIFVYAPIGAYTKISTALSMGALGLLVKATSSVKARSGKRLVGLAS